MRCAICRKDVPVSASEHKPFCSERCRTIDLGKWLDGGYRIERPVAEEDLDEGVPGADGPRGDGDGGRDRN